MKLSSHQFALLAVIFSPRRAAHWRSLEVHSRSLLTHPPAPNSFYGSFLLLLIHIDQNIQEQLAATALAVPSWNLHEKKKPHTAAFYSWPDDDDVRVQITLKFYTCCSFALLVHQNEPAPCTSSAFTLFAAPVSSLCRFSAWNAVLIFINKWASTQKDSTATFNRWVRWLKAFFWNSRS